MHAWECKQILNASNIPIKNTGSHSWKSLCIDYKLECEMI